ncbi:hypothetical protein HMPREF9318_01725 [Streptococcus urinalis FB127-CNA-2]|uniref:Transcriptional regulator, MarR family n=1 Tax=Streptococcus urinalis 2285-97 TaxID=764291 RepID=G5KEC1_9STRE|nr:MarR family transcriptional regulator [Streptococcus urinalis]EHJ57644.1 transcriptional regulator, MarR family [Streptococcus urinalis 2285-97]EKS18226.1 hypothetical protein HMPREF9318_01725 [Streptococcus urinalis FB127-CNA-2]VEF32899.1 MarR family transcriptional regulator [Streptococcus urinalis]
MDIKSNIPVLIKRVSLKFEKEANHILTEYNVTASQLKTLKFLFGHPNLTVTQHDIELFFSMTNPTVTGILQNLEKKNFIFRQQNPNDARSKVIGFTEQSLQFKTKLEQLSHQLETDLTKQLTNDEHQTLIYLLTKLLNDNDKVD